MSKLTKIQWTDSTTNPTMGCEGCELWRKTQRSCYAGILHSRFGGRAKGYAPSFGQVTLFRGRMVEAAGWTSLDGTERPEKPWLNGLPRLIFISDMSDALSSAVPFGFLREEIIGNVRSAQGSRHQWLWLTKRPERMARFSDWLAAQGTEWPSNLWAGTSVTTKVTAKRIEKLFGVGDDRTGRFVSVEPQLEWIALSPWLRGLDWVIQGGESGQNARSFDIGWARELGHQCRERRVPYSLKQLGTRPTESDRRVELKHFHGGDWNEWPLDLKVREILKERLGLVATSRRER